MQQFQLALDDRRGVDIFERSNVIAAMGFTEENFAQLMRFQLPTTDVCNLPLSEHFLDGLISHSLNCNPTDPYAQNIKSLLLLLLKQPRYHQFFDFDCEEPLSHPMLNDHDWLAVGQHLLENYLTKPPFNSKLVALCKRIFKQCFAHGLNEAIESLCVLSIMDKEYEQAWQWMKKGIQLGLIETKVLLEGLPRFLSDHENLPAELRSRIELYYARLKEIIPEDGQQKSLEVNILSDDLAALSLASRSLTPCFGNHRTQSTSHRRSASWDKSSKQKAKHSPVLEVCPVKDPKPELV